MIAGLREAKLSGNRKVKVHFLPGAKTEDLFILFIYSFFIVDYLHS